MKRFAKALWEIFFSAAEEVGGILTRRKLLDQVLNIVKKFDQDAFYTIEDVRAVARLNLFI